MTSKGAYFKRLFSRSKDDSSNLTEKITSDDSVEINKLTLLNQKLEDENAALTKELKKLNKKFRRLNRLREKLVITESELLQQNNELAEKEALVSELIAAKIRAEQERQSMMLIQQLQDEEKANVLARVEAEKLKKYQCSICFSKVDTSQIFWYDTCLHDDDNRLCLTCMHHYCRGKVVDGETEIKCPVTDCESVLGFDAVGFLLQDRKLMEKYENFLYTHALEGMEDISYCPNKKCATPAPRRGMEDMVTCLKCKLEYCFKCHEEWHTGVTCEEYQKWKEKYKGDSDDTIKFLIWAKKNGTKKCPGGHDCIKISGCNKMVCPRCKMDWCWECGQKLRGYTHPGDGRCPGGY